MGYSGSVCAHLFLGEAVERGFLWEYSWQADDFV